MPSRILSTLLLWSVLLAGLWYFGVHAAVVLLTVLTVLTLHEFYQMTARLGHRPFHGLGLVVAALITGVPYYLSHYVPDVDAVVGFVPALLALAGLAACVRSLGERTAETRLEAVGATMLGLLYIPFSLHYLVRLILLPADDTSGLVLCLWVVAVTKFCDVGALLTGLAVGRHKMAPTISPKKTWEGAVGGVLIAAGLGAGIAAFAPDYLPEKFTPLVGAIVAVPVACAGIVSDLIESALKRRADVKDAGTLIPGIGGAFDLTDSLILAVPLAYLIIMFLV